MKDGFWKLDQRSKEWQTYTPASSIVLFTEYIIRDVGSQETNSLSWGIVKDESAWPGDGEAKRDIRPTQTKAKRLRVSGQSTTNNYWGSAASRILKHSLLVLQ